MNRTHLVSRRCIPLFIMLSSCVPAVALSTRAFAAEVVAGGGYTGPGPELATVKQALAMQAHTPCSLRGRITRFVPQMQDGDHAIAHLYEFADSTDTITIAIDRNAWLGQYVSGLDIVEITVIRRAPNPFFEALRVLKRGYWPTVGISPSGRLPTPDGVTILE